MAQIKPGDHPVVDMFEYKRHPFPYDIEMMLRKLDQIDKNLLDSFEEYYIDWTREKRLAEGRKKLREALMKYGLSEKDITELIRVPPLNRNAAIVNFIARAIAFVWVLWWIIFNIRLYTQRNSNVEPSFANILLALIVLVSVIIQLKLDILGALLIILEGLFITVAFMDATPRDEWLSQAHILFIVGIPGVIAGLGMLIAWSRRKRSIDQHIEKLFGGT